MSLSEPTDELTRATDIIRNAKRLVAFTGAGISVESGIPPFRGPDGLWSRYDPQVLDLTFFQQHPEDSWKVIKEIFYDFFGKARPNPGHLALAELERAGILKGIITQNIDNLHQEAGSRNVVEFHGSSRRLSCLSCSENREFREDMLAELPPICPDCGGLLKPDFIFFGEGIPPHAYQRSEEETQNADVWLVVGTTGEIMPASMLPIEAHGKGAAIIEVNLHPSNYTSSITDIFLQGKAGVVLRELADRVI
ncbi:MAG: RNA polymerase subunit sigma [Spirochaetes bacterium]|nr:MAG: RNA polymerase subunit sigma [Spirochaetota bacterium]